MNLIQGNFRVGMRDSEELRYDNESRWEFNGSLYNQQ